MTELPNLDTNNFDYFLNEVWPEHVHFNSGVKRVFKEDKTHENKRKTYIKLLFLDKAYSAGLRRWVKRCAKGKCPTSTKKKYCGCDPVEIIVRELKVQNKTSGFRKVLARATEIAQAGTLTRSNQKRIVQCHQAFSKVFMGQIRNAYKSKKKPKFQSFTSKYLWFHAGVFPVFDRVARVGLKRLQERGTKQCETYEELVDQIISLMEKLYEKESDPKFTPDQIKMVDGYLIWIGARAENMEWRTS